MTSEEFKLAVAKIDELATILKSTLVFTCTCYADPERSCTYCNLMIQADKIYAELNGV